MSETRVSRWRDYYELCKPRVVMLMLLTAVVGMLLATPGWLSWQVLVFATIGIGLSASSGAVLNHIIDRKIDAIMRRTHHRPVASGRISTVKALIFAIGLGIAGMAILIVWVNFLTAVLTFIALIGYAIIYTVFLKRSTPQNIVIGGLAGAMPPLLGWTAVTGQMEFAPWLLVLIIFLWTPPHFWALSIYRYEDYAKVNIPMLPVVRGIPYTKVSILIYTMVLAAATVLPFVFDMSGIIYLIGVLILDAIFLYWAIKLKLTEDPKVALKTFNYSIIYLMVLFLVLLLDHYLMLFI